MEILSIIKQLLNLEEVGINSREMTNLSNIPNEVIELILQDESLSFTDVIHFGRTNSRYWNLINKSNQTWKPKFKQMWPGLIVRECYNNGEGVNWKEEFKVRHLIGRETMKQVKAMSAKHMNQQELCSRSFEPFEHILNNCSHKLAIYFMMHELQCVHHNDLVSNLTEKYYSDKVITHLRQMDMKKKLKEFKNKPLEEQLLEHVAVFVAQWSQPTIEITSDSISSRLDHIAEKVLKEIQLDFGEKHPALHVPSEVRARWRSRNIPDNQYSPYVSRQVIETISKVLFKQLNFHGNSDHYYSVENSYINQVLERGQGIPITLSIVYESVARRVGIKCEPVSFPGHFLLRWRDSYKDGTKAQFSYLDVFNGGVFLGRNDCPQLANQGGCPMDDIFRYGAATPIQVLERMANNLEVAGRQRTVMNGRTTRLRSALELQHAINPANLNCIHQLSRFYLQYSMDVSDLLRSLQELSNLVVRDIGQAASIERTLTQYIRTNDTQRCSVDKKSRVPDVVKLRNPDLKYAVGLIMHHKMLGYTCVIFGWDPVCMASESWKQQMRVSRLKRQDNQPFYHVLVNDGTDRYAAEENLQLECDPCRRWIDHCQVGRYFDTFCNTHYHMNQEMMKIYPQDSQIMEELTIRYSIFSTGAYRWR